MPCSSAWPIAVPIAPTTRPATGSTSWRQAGVVLSTHPVRVQARGLPPVAGSSVTGSSQRSASRQASTTSRSCSGVTGTSSGRVRPVATSEARSQLTGPPFQLMSFCSWPNIPAMSVPEPPSIPARPNGSSGSSGRSEEPKPKGGRVIAALP